LNFIYLGEPTDNSAEFIEWINSSDRTSEETMKNVPFALFALGNRQYEHFCAVGKKLDERLEALGGIRVIEHGEGDDDGSLEDDFNNWKKDFWAATHAKFGTKANDDDIKQGELKKFESSFNVMMLGSGEEETKYNGGINNLITDPKHRVVKALVSENRELRQSIDDGSSTKHIDFDLTGLRTSYITADNLGVYPRNDYKLTGKIIKRLGLRPEQLFKTKAKPGKKSPFPNPCSIQDAFLWYLDFNYTPRLPHLPILAQYTKDEKEKEKLLYYAHLGKDEYVSDHKSFQELLDEFPNVMPPFQDLIDFVPKLAPRYYTISSSSVVTPNLCSITVSLMIHNKPRGRMSYGICSNYLCSLNPQKKDQAAIFIRQSSFRFPKPKIIASVTIPAENKQNNDTNTQTNHPPIIMIGPGTGIAPFRGFIQEVAHLRNKGIQVGETRLYFGCRNSDKDYIYREELRAAQECKTLQELHVAFSRDSKVPKTYVQDIMKTQGADLWQRIHTGKGYIFICGGTAMGRSVRECILKMAVEHGEMTEKQAEEYIKKMQTDKRFVQELWS
jgi:NADPH-ferrihemoprotein reductase